MIRSNRLSVAAMVAALSMGSGMGLLEHPCISAPRIRKAPRVRVCNYRGKNTINRKSGVYGGADGVLRVGRAKAKRLRKRMARISWCGGMSWGLGCDYVLEHVYKKGIFGA